MKRIFSVSHQPTALDIALLILRATVAATMMHHGYGKLVKFDEIQPEFMNFMGLGTTLSLWLTIFAELFCSVLLLIGIATRVVLVPLIITMLVAVFNAHEGDIFGKGEPAFIYLMVYITLILTGPGRYSVDGLLSKRMDDI